MADKYLFIDRDGVINKDLGGREKGGYVIRRENICMIPGALDALKKISDAGYAVVVISNQQCVGKGYMTHNELDDITEEFTRQMSEAGVNVGGFFYCTHLEDENCDCRKPKPGLFWMARKKLGISDFNGYFYIGDSERDMQVGKDAGLKTMLVLSGKASYDDTEHWYYKPDYISEDLNEAIEVILKKS